MKMVFIHIRRSIKKLKIIAVLCLASLFSNAQVDTLPGDPGVIKAYTVQNLNFGTFSAGNAGGTLIISPAGTRTATGSVVSISQGVQPTPAIFDIDVLLGSIVSILNGPDVALTGSNGGSMTMHIGVSDPASPFITVVRQPARTPVRVGATLTVGSQAANPPGTYTGTFYVTFNLE
jgi:hypothetical protein